MMRLPLRQRCGSLQRKTRSSDPWRSRPRIGMLAPSTSPPRYWCGTQLLTASPTKRAASLQRQPPPHDPRRTATIPPRSFAARRPLAATTSSEEAPKPRDAGLFQLLNDEERLLLEEQRRLTAEVVRACCVVLFLNCRTLNEQSCARGASSFLQILLLFKFCVTASAEIGCAAGRCFHSPPWKCGQQRYYR